MARMAIMMLLLLVHCLVARLALSVTNFTDESALLALKARITSEPNNILAQNWSEGTSFCSWVGVSCSLRHRRVTALNLPNMGLNGTIPRELGNLSFLISFNISNNNFQGHLPDELGHLRRLKSLDLQFNELGGDIPTSFGFLTKLQNMILSYNSFTGSIPKEIGNLPNLQMLNIRNNTISGSIPSTVFNISFLRRIDFSNNQLSGTLPVDVCIHLPVLEFFSVANNQLSGVISTSLSKCGELRQLLLESNRFSGSIPKAFGNLTKLEMLYLGWNNLIGPIPDNICHQLPRLEVISVPWNQLSGEIPSSLSYCKALRILYMSYNEFTGAVPSQIGNLSALQAMYLRRNNLTGIIPSSFGNLSMLEEIGITENNIHGNIPRELGQLLNLKYLSFGANNLTGKIPVSIFNISGLQIISLAYNNLSGSLPSSIGLSLPNLEYLLVSSNQFSGIIPSSISNATLLSGIDLSHNFFYGNVPTTFGYLVHLQFLRVESNQLTNDPSTLELGFLTALTNCRDLDTLVVGINPLNGILPKSVGNLSTSLEAFYISASGIKGTIPSEIGNLSNLVILSLGENNFTGSIPITVGQLRKIQQLEMSNSAIEGWIPSVLCNLPYLGSLVLSENKLSGSIPSCFKNLTSLRELYLDSNALTSQIPSPLWSLTDIRILNLSSNFLSGSLELEIGNLKSITQLDISRNQLTGNISSTIGQLQNLIKLSLSRNRLEGPITQSFGDMVSMEYLDLSQNNLSGVIPKSLENLLYLRYLNVSFNKLTGEIPIGGPFTNFTAESFMWNDALCGAARFQVIECNGYSHGQSKTKVLLKYILPSIVLVAIAASIIWWVWCRSKNAEVPIQDDSPLGPTHRRISHHEIVHATNNFSEDHLIGRGSLSLVYKGTFFDGMIFAIKVFNLELQGAFKSFDRECEVMRNIRHRNLIKIISSCSNPDFKALVLEYMPNGSLEKCLYSHNYFLNIVQRLSIMIDVASALEYLHHGYSTLVVHCDLKPSNILLDEDMVAHVGDFGISKLFSERESMAQTKTLGTIGYMAPEYGSAGIMSTKGDVYSYGILLMETFTRKKPTDDLFLGELSIKRWVSESLSSAITEVVDGNLLSGDYQMFTTKEKCLSLIMELALQCTAESPEERINMKDVLVRLKKIKTRLDENVKAK